MLISANMMIRDEPFAVYGLASIIDYIDEAIVVDTGSMDGTFEELQEFAKNYPSKIILEQRDIENCHNWNISGSGDNQVKTENLKKEAAQALGDTRRYMHEKSSGEFIWIIDGDEVYFKILAEQVRDIVQTNMSNADILFIPFADYIDKIGTIRQIHDMGRIFRKDVTDIKGIYPTEMHFNKVTNNMYYAGCDRSLMIEPTCGFNFVQHYECIIKPYRKERRHVQEIPKVLPEVFEQLIDKFPRVKKYIEG